MERLAEVERALSRSRPCEPSHTQVAARNEHKVQAANAEIERLRKESDRKTQENRESAIMVADLRALNTRIEQEKEKLRQIAEGLRIEAESTKKRLGENQECQVPVEHLGRLLDLLSGLDAPAGDGPDFVKMCTDRLDPALKALAEAAPDQGELVAQVEHMRQSIRNAGNAMLAQARQQVDAGQTAAAVRSMADFLDGRQPGKPPLNARTVEEHLRAITMEAFKDAAAFRKLRPALDACLEAAGLSLLLPTEGQTFQSSRHSIAARARVEGRGANCVFRVVTPGLMRGDKVVAKAHVEIT